MQRTSVKPMSCCNGRNQFIPTKISFNTNFIGMIRMQMKRITSKCPAFVIAMQAGLSFQLNGRISRICNDVQQRRLFSACSFFSLLSSGAFSMRSQFSVSVSEYERYSSDFLRFVNDSHLGVSQTLRTTSWRICIRTRCITSGWRPGRSAAKAPPHRPSRFAPSNTVSYPNSMAVRLGTFDYHFAIIFAFDFRSASVYHFTEK